MPTPPIPADVLSGDPVASADINAILANLRDPSTILASMPMLTYTPGWTAVTTNPTLGNGAIEGRYEVDASKMVTATIMLTMGSTTTYGSGSYGFTLPVAARGGFNSPTLVTAILYDTSAPARYLRGGYLPTPTELFLTDESGANVAATSPATWATGDTISITVRYEAAP